MSDLGHKMTDEMIEELEKKITREYQQAYKDVSKKLNDYMSDFKAKDAEMWKKVKDGNMTQEAYLDWRKKKMLTGKRWKEMKQTLAEDLTKVNEKTRSIIGDYMPDAYALNHNYATFAVEKASRLNTSYTLYNRETVEHLLKDDEKLLPYPRKLSPTARKLAERADIIWNREHLNSQITQGVLQGESIPDIAKRLMKVVGMNRNVAVRNARTMMTSAENKGKEDAYDRLEEKGIELERQWVSTLDNRTRHSHRLMHGEVKDPETGLYSNGLKYPGDPDGEPEEVYNCRCSEIAFVKGHPIDIPKYSPKMTMSYEEWLGEHEEAKEAVSIEEPKKPDYSFGGMVSNFTPAKTREEAESYADQFVSSYKSKYSGNVSYKGVDVEYANASNKVLTEVFQRYNIDTLSDIMPMNKRENRWKDTTADASYQWGGSGGRLFFNASYYKNSKILNEHIKEGKDLLSTVLNGVDVLLKKDMSETKRNYIEALIESKVQCVAQKLPAEEYATCTFVHESGHMLDDKIFGKMFKEKGFDVADSMKNFGKTISGYAVTNRQEYIAESFASYWYGFDIDPELAQIFKEAESYGRQ